MTLEDESIDFLVSFAVFEHLPDPGVVLDEILRVLKPGGGVYIAIHLYTSDSGCHDVGGFDSREGRPGWAHLRPQHAHTVVSNSYLNKLRLDDWCRLFENKMPSVQFVTHQYGKEKALERIRTIREAGELIGYTDEELSTVDLVAVWRKDSEPVAFEAMGEEESSAFGELSCLSTTGSSEFEEQVD